MWIYFHFFVCDFHTNYSLKIFSLREYYYKYIYDSSFEDNIDIQNNKSSFLNNSDDIRMIIERSQYLIQTIQIQELINSLKLIYEFTENNFEDYLIINKIIEKLVIFLDYFDKCIEDGKRLNDCSKIDYLDHISQEQQKLL